jgi:hypothetical protein
MNAMYMCRLPAHAAHIPPADPANGLRKLKATLLDEANEIDDIVAAFQSENLAVRRSGRKC